MIGSFTLIKNEAPWIGAHLEMWLPHLSEMVFFDGNSTDGTVEIILDVIHNHRHGYKVKLFTDKDPKNLQEDYVRLFDECLHSVESDLAFFLHPDMLPARVPANSNHMSGAIAASVAMRSFGGEPEVSLYEIKGRCPDWKNIYRLRNPDLGAHYHGHYGHETEDVYFKAITGDKHILKEDLTKYPYPIVKSGIEVLHFSDVRPYERRIERMVKCLANNKWPEDDAKRHAADHPRVTFKSGGQFKFEPAEWPIEYVEARKKYRHLEKGAHAIA